MSTEERMFYPWMLKNDAYFAAFDQSPENMERKAYLLHEGVRCVDWFPKDVAFKMDDEAGIVLPDSVPNSDMLLIVSEKLRSILEENTSEEIEYLPISIIDHQGQTVDTSYHIVNVLKVLPCMNQSESDFVVSSLDKTQVHHIKRLVLDESKIPEETNIFRLGEEKNRILVSHQLAKHVLEAGCTGVSYIDIRDYGKQYRPVDRLALVRNAQREK